jgi:alpha-tubulin suppressor-like RCC1 family protein
VPSTVTEFQYYVYVMTKMPAENVQAIADIPAHAFDLLAVGQAHTCAVRPGTTGNAGTYAYCWGFDNTGAIGTATTQTAVTIPLGVLGYESFATVTSGTDFSCALAGSQAYCWGDNSRGEVGDGTTTDRLEPTAVAGGFSFSQIAAGTEFACGLQSSGTAYCWGANNFGQLGNGTTTDLTAPTSGKAVGSGAESFVSIAVGAYHACGYTSTGAVYCWGGNAAGALGQPVDSVPHPTPTVVGAVTVQSIAAGDNFTCGVAVSTGQVECWGANLYGGLGDGTTTSRSTPETAGAFHACAATAAGVTYCWGDNSVGQLGTGTSTGTDLYVPTPVSGSYAFNTVDAGFGHTCALTGSGSTLCWGDNSVGELGNGTTSSTPSTTPVAVDLP